MDRATNTTAPADRLVCAVELSKNSWLLGIQFPDRQKASIYPLKGGSDIGKCCLKQSWSYLASRGTSCPDSDTGFPGFPVNGRRSCSVSLSTS
jgi:hypothetical protein